MRWVIVALFLPCLAFADQLRLTGILRDLNDTHPDMEGELGTDRGIVEQRLGADGKPVYAPENSSETTHGPIAFYSWYNDAPGVNMRAPIVLTLVNSAEDPRVYTFRDLEFFPIDGRLLGNQGRPHNYHFTVELHTTFVYEGGEHLTFEGDDDLWVFVNGYRVIDLGGVHGVETETADFDAIAREAGLVRGQVYPLDLFYAERHTVDAHFTLSTTVRFEDAGDPGDPGGGGSGGGGAGGSGGGAGSSGGGSGEPGGPGAGGAGGGDPGGAGGNPGAGGSGAGSGEPGAGGGAGEPGGGPREDPCLNDPTCVIPCSNGECPYQRICRDELCVDPCLDVLCAPNETCVGGLCAAGLPEGVDLGFIEPPPASDAGTNAGDGAGSDCSTTPGVPPAGLPWWLAVWVLRRRRA
jgi:fibro-slime domain-containing protein